MKRACLIFLALYGCGKEALPQKPQLMLDPEELTFGAFVGTRPQQSLQLWNGGLENLKITSVSIAGDQEFTIEGPLALELKGKERTFIRVFFDARAARAYAATLTIVSNAENTPTKLVTITGTAVAPDGGQ